MTAKPGTIDSNRLGVCSQRPIGGSIAACRAVTTVFLFFIVIFFPTGCATMARHQFVEPTGDWQAKSGQLMYRTAKTTLIGDVLVRFSKGGDFELTFSKGPGVTLLSLRQDASFAEVKGAFVRQGWSGPVEQAPQQLRGWLDLRDKLIHSQDRPSVRYVTGNETFRFRF